VHDVGVKSKQLFLLAVFRRRPEYPALKRAVREQQSLFNATVVLIEDKALGTQLIQELIGDGCYGVTRYQPTTDKIMRLHAQTAIIENGFVHILETATWLAEYLHELTVFPRGKHDDQADSTAQFLDWFKTPMPSWGIFEYTRQLAEAAEQRAANRHQSKPYGLAAPWSGLPSRMRRGQPRLPPCLIPRRISTHAYLHHRHWRYHARVWFRAASMHLARRRERLAPAARRSDRDAFCARLVTDAADPRAGTQSTAAP
jgi:predicted phage terminase large subunit-like protein